MIPQKRAGYGVYCEQYGNIQQIRKELENFQHTDALGINGTFEYLLY